MRSAVIIGVLALNGALSGLTGQDAGSDTSSAFEALAAVPLGVESHQVLKPSFSGGLMSSLIEAATVVKVSEEQLDMTDMTLRLKGKTEAGDIEVALLSASYHLPTKVLTSDEHAIVRRSDFVIEGDSLIYDTRKSVGQMIGNVTTIIDLPQKSTESDQPKPQEKR